MSLYSKVKLRNYVSVGAARHSSIHPFNNFSKSVKKSIPVSYLWCLGNECADNSFATLLHACSGPVLGWGPYEVLKQAFTLSHLRSQIFASQKCWACQKHHSIHYQIKEHCYSYKERFDKTGNRQGQRSLFNTETYLTILKPKYNDSLKKK